MCGSVVFGVSDKQPYVFHSHYLNPVSQRKLEIGSQRLMRIVEIH